ncbi:MAG: ROK family protein, partial [Dehalococcoidia bacterium]|nr:ROK family protein [Dehalococcoidia bacterium]
MKAPGKPVIAIDIGGTKYIVGVIDCNGKILSRIYRYTLSAEGPQKLTARLMSAIDEAVKQSGVQGAGLGGIAVAYAGLVDIGKGLVTEAPNLPNWNNVPLRDMLANRYGIPAFVLNDANAAALGEHRLGAGKGLSNMIFITVSTGIGGGIIINNELYNGTDGCAGEIGHMVLEVDGPQCNCGRKGCWESLASGSAIARIAKERLGSGEQSILADMTAGNIDGVTAELVSKGAKKGDALCLEVINEAACYLGIGLANLVNIFNPQMIVIGGGVSSIGEMILRPARQYMEQHAFKLPAGTVRVVKAGLGVDSGLLGAAVY